MRKTRMVITILTVMTLCSCAKFDKRMAWGYRALHWTKLAGEAVDTGLAAWLRSKTNACVEKHGRKTEGYAECITPALEFVRKWTGCTASDANCSAGMVSIIQSAQKASLDSLEVAWSAKKGDVYAAIKPSICALAEFVQAAKSAGVDFGKANESIDKVLALSVTLCK